MALLASGGFRTLTVDQLLLAEGDLGRAVVITFDDGWADNFHHALPILREHGLIATVFVLSGSIGQPGYLTWDQLRTMAAAGMSIQSHSVSHRPLGELSGAEVHQELSASRQAIAEHLGRPVTAVSLPHGSKNPDVMVAAKTCGYRAICTSEPGFQHRHEELLELGRINISNDLTIDRFARMVRMDSLSIMPELVGKKTKNFLKRLIGYNTYRRLYRARHRIQSGEQAVRP
jgi:peptidoglycan/xylan/chitin deacetylase (PgdA/CDA1 family)